MMARTNMSEQQPVRGPMTTGGRPFVPGYQSVLCRRELKERLTEIRRGYPNGSDTNMERCLTSALLEYALRTLSSNELKSLLLDALRKDLEVTSSSFG